MTLRLPLALALLLLAHGWAPAQELLSYQNIDGQKFVESHVSALSGNVEAADDFDLVASIERLVVRGHLSFQSTQEVDGVRVAFYEWTADGPGALQYEATIPAGDPDLGFHQSHPETMFVWLDPPFEASGKHFVSLQLLSSDWVSWRWWTANSGAWTMSMAQGRVGGGPWGPISDITGPVDADLAFDLWGTDATPPPPSTEPCGAWVEDFVPLLPQTQHSILRDVAAIAADDAWAVDNPAVGPSTTTIDLRTSTVHWDGEQWKRVPTPNPEAFPGAGAGLWGIDAAGPKDVWAVGYQSKQDAHGFIGAQALAMRWDGGQWQVVETPGTDLGVSGAFGRAVEAIAPDDVWFVGDYPGLQGQLPMHFHWNGSEIVQVPLGFSPPGPVGMEAVSASASDDVWTVGGGGDGDLSPFSVIFHWDGGSWSHVPGPTPGYGQRLFAVAAIAPDDVWASGQYFDLDGVHLLMIHWDGSSWTQVDAPAGSLGLFAFASDDVYAVGGGVAHWDGSAWTLVEDFHSVPDLALSAIDAAGPCELFAVGRKDEGILRSFAARVVADGVSHFCGATPNSTGAPATIELDGVASLSDGDPLLVAGSCPPGQVGLFFFGAGAIQAPLGDGYLCIGPGLYRLGLATISPAGTAGHWLDAEAPAPGAPAIVAGSSWRFQYWYRDPGFGAAGHNLTDAIVVRFGR